MIATMYNQIVSFLAVLFVAFCDATSDTAERDAFYKQVSTVSRSLDPRDYIVGSELNQSYSYNNAHMDMIGEMTIFYYAEAVANKTVTLSFTSADERDYNVMFEIREEGAYLIEGNVVMEDINYARVDGNMMRFYVCFLGKLCPMNAVNIKHPLTHFKLESDDINALMRIFIKGFFLDWATDTTAPTRLISLSRATITVNHHVSRVHVCVFHIQNQLIFGFRDYYIMGAYDREMIFYGPRQMEVRFLSLRFAIMMRISDIGTDKRPKVRILMPWRLPTATVVFSASDIAVNIDHRCKAI